MEVLKPITTQGLQVITITKKNSCNLCKSITAKNNLLIIVKSIIIMSINIIENNNLNPLEEYNLSLDYHLAENESWQLTDDKLQFHYLHLEYLENLYAEDETLTFEQLCDKYRDTPALEDMLKIYYPDSLKVYD